MSFVRKCVAIRSGQGEEENVEHVEQRSGAERRRFSYTAYIPERRSGRDRRNRPESEWDLIKD